MPVSYYNKPLGTDIEDAVQIQMEAFHAWPEHQIHSPAIKRKSSENILALADDYS